MCVQYACAQTMLLRATREPVGTVMVGQTVHIFADVLFPDEMAYPPRVASPRVEGAQVLRFESQATTMGPGLSLEAIVPPGFDPAEPIVASPDVTLTESWAPFPSGTFHVGDALKRVVTRRATDVPGLALAALDFVAPHISARRAAWGGAERIAFRNLERACRTAEPKATFRALQRWIACRVGESSSPQLNAQTAILERHLFGPSRGRNRGDARRLGQAAQLLRRQRHHRKTINALPPLNPTS